MKTLFCATITSFVILFQSSGIAQQLDEGFKVYIKGRPDLVIEQAADGNYLIGGRIDFLGSELSGAIVKLDAKGQPVAGFKKITSDGSFSQIKALSGGKFLASGVFTKVNGQASQKLVRFHADGSMDTEFSIGSSADIRTFDVQSTGNIIITGTFTNFAGKGYNYVARLLANGTLDETFGKPALASSVLGVAVNASDELLLNRIGVLTKLTPEGAIDNTFTSPELGAPVQFDYIDNLSSEWMVSYTKFSASEYKLIKLNNNGAIHTNFTQIQTPGQIGRFSILSNGYLAVTGVFTQYNGVSANVVLFKPDGTFDRILCVTNTNFITHISADAANGIIVAGGFIKINNIERLYIARFKSDYSIDPDFKPELTQCFLGSLPGVQSKGKLLFAGEYDMVGVGFVRSHLIRLNADGTVDLSFNPAINQNTSHITALTVQPDDKILVSGIFVIDQFISGLVRLLPDGQIDNSFSIGLGPQMGSESSYAQLVRYNNGKIYVAGSFTQFNSQPYSRLVVLDQNGTIIGSSTSLPSNSFFTDLEVQSDGKIVLLGFFPLADGNRKLIRLNGDGTLDSTFPAISMATGVLRDIEIDSKDRVVVAGLWDTFNGIAVKNIARINADGTIDASFRVGDGFSQYLSHDVLSIKILPTDILAVSGSFDTYNTEPAPGIALFNSDGEKLQLTTGFNSSTVIRRLVYANNMLVGTGRIVFGIGENVSSAIKINFDIEVGTDGFSNEAHPLAAYPNPFTGNIQLTLPINGGDAYVKLCSQTGTVLLEQHAFAGSTIDLDTHSLPAGLFILKVQLDNQRTKYCKLVKR